MLTFTKSELMIVRLHFIYTNLNSNPYESLKSVQENIPVPYERFAHSSLGIGQFDSVNTRFTLHESHTK